MRALTDPFLCPLSNRQIFTAVQRLNVAAQML